jgi:hypothetical protein
MFKVKKLLKENILLSFKESYIKMEFTLVSIQIYINLLGIVSMESMEALSTTLELTIKVMKCLISITLVYPNTELFI